MMSSRRARLARALFALAVVLAFVVAAAQTESELTLTAALEIGSENAAAVVAAKDNLADARRDLEVAAADPSTTPLALAAAERKVAGAEDDLALALATANGEVVSAFAEVLQAAANREAAALQLNILETILEATNARFAAGAVTSADVTKAESDVANQQRTLQEAETDLTFAEDSLAALLGVPVGPLAPITEADLLPEDELAEMVDGAAATSARLAAARRNLDAARAQLAAVDNALSSRAEIDAARKAVESAEDALNDVEDAMEREVRRARASVTAARNRYRGALDAAESATADLAAQAVRLEAGTVSALAYAQSELALKKAEASTAAALHGLLKAQYSLMAATLR